MNLGDQYFNVKSWDGRNIKWAWYSKDHKTVYILDQKNWGFSLDFWNVSNLIGKYCLQLFTKDKWNRVIASNKFYVDITPAPTQAITNTFETINIYPNYYTEINIPIDLIFRSVDDNFYYSSYWTDNSTGIASRIFKNKNGTLNLLVEAFGDKGWKLSLSILDSFCQTTELLIDVNVLRCASKDWIKWKGPLQNDWLICK